MVSLFNYDGTNRNLARVCSCSTLAAGTMQPNGLKRDGERITAVVVNYNGGDPLIECVRSLTEQTRKPAHIVVVDNQSVDGSCDNLRSVFPNVPVIRNERNLGWGIACNIGIQSTSDEYVALINNDAYLDKNCLEQMFQALVGRPEYGSCASKILLWDRRDTIEAAAVSVYRDGSSVGRGRLRPASEFITAEDVFCACDCCCLYRRSMLGDIGMYDPDFFIYCDETDMGWRHQLAGWRCVLAPAALAYHAHSRAAGTYSDFKAYYVERNRIYICLKYFPVDYLLASVFFSVYRYTCQLGFARSGSGALGKYLRDYSLAHGFRTLARAHMDAFRNSRKMLARRRKLRRIRRVSRQDFETLFARYGVTTREIARYE